MLHHRLHLAGQFALYPHGVIQARRIEVQLRRNIVDDIDAADESHCTIHHRQLAVHAAQATHAVAAQGEGRYLAPEPLHLDSRLAQLLHKRFRKFRRAEPIQQQPHRHSACRRALQGFCDQLPGLVGGEDIGLQIDGALCRIDVGAQLRKECRAVLQQHQFVPRDPVDSIHVFFNCADSAA